MSPLTCELCGQRHTPARLAPGEKASCARCGAMLAKVSRSGPDTALAFSLAGLALSVPAIFLPFISAGKLGDVRVSRLLTGVGAFWDRDMLGTGLLVLLCGTVLPLILFACLAALHALGRPAGAQPAPRFLIPLARTLEHWAIPEVQVLAILVALTKLGSQVEVTIGPGFVCYCGVALCLIVAERSFDFDVGSPSAAAAEPPGGASA